MREFGASIVLERSDSAPPEEIKAGSKSRYPWATAQEVVPLIESLGGETSTALLAQEIAGKHGIDLDLVRKHLLKSEDIKWLRVDREQWAIPKQEYDL